MIKLITSLVAILTVASVQAQATLKEAPKLVIAITVDQLRGDYLEMFQHNFTERGFKRLLNGGLVYQNIAFDFPNINAPAAITTIHTGANPSYHGITGYRKYDVNRGLELSTFSDDEFIGNYTQDKLSPKALKVSTIADELRLASRGYSNVYAFAPNAEESMASVGNAANCAYWINDSNGKWATTTFYKNTHWSVDTENRNGVYSSSAGSLVWKPLLQVGQYNAFPYTFNGTSFQHFFDNYQQVKKTPLTNENTGNVGLTLVEKIDMGKDAYPDFLALTFYLGNYPKSLDKNYSIEIQDAYVRLDRTIEQLLDRVDKTVGLNNALVVVASTGYYNADEVYLPEVNMPGGVFYVNRCEALLNMYLMAIYGKEQWVDKIYNNQVYLNRKLIASKNLNLSEFQDKAAEFIVQFTGVQDAATAYQIMTNKANDSMVRFKNIFNKDISGDVFIEIQSGFKVVNEQDKVDTSEKRIRETAIPAPVIFFGNNIKAEKVKRTIKATEIAPSVSRILRIRAPNASRMQALPELM